MTSNPNLAPLTPAIVMDLRVSISYRGSADGAGHIGVPFMVYAPAEDAFVLHAYGSAQAMHSDPLVLAQVMRCERAEAGFIRRILSAQEPCDVATLAPDERARYAATQAHERRRLAQQHADASDALQRRARALDVSKISLDDI